MNDIPDSLSPEEQRDRFLSVVRRIIEETPPTEPYRISKRVEESFWAGRDPRTGERLPDKDIPKPKGPYIPLALRK